MSSDMVGLLIVGSGVAVFLGFIWWNVADRHAPFHPDSTEDGIALIVFGALIAGLWPLFVAAAVVLSVLSAILWLPSRLLVRLARRR